MDLSKLGQNEKLALSGAIVVLISGTLSSWGGLLWLTILAAAGVAVVVYLPRLLPTTSLPGSRGSLLAALGILALASGVIELLRWLGWTFDTLGRFSTLLFLASLASSAVMAWAGWSELQAEGGKWVFGTPSAGPGTVTATPAADADATAARPNAFDAVRSEDEGQPPA
jgi:hypothetical protein